jgi:hypothetical protein
VAEVTFDRETRTATVTMKDTTCELTKDKANKALLVKGEKFKVATFSEKK